MMTRRRGFSLIEVMVSMGILAVIIMLLSSTVGSGRIPWAQTSAQIQLAAVARQASLQINRELMMSTPSRVFLTTDRQSIRFCIPLVDAQGDMRRSTGGDILWGDGDTENNFIRYLMRDNRLVRQSLNAGLFVQEEQVVGEHLQSFFVDAFSAPHYRLQLVFTMPIEEGLAGGLAATLNTTISVRCQN